MEAAVISGRPASDGFGDYLDRFRGNPSIKGLRQVLHTGATPASYCLETGVLFGGVRMLGDRGLSFDLCLRNDQLEAGAELIERCPGTRFILDPLRQPARRLERPSTAGGGGSRRSPGSRAARLSARFPASTGNVKGRRLAGRSARADRPVGDRPLRVGPGDFSPATGRSSISADRTEPGSRPLKQIVRQDPAGPIRRSCSGTMPSSFIGCRKREWLSS